jgi:hypothetical protein
VVITSKEWQEWAHHPLTKEFKKLILDSKEGTKDVWSAGGYVGETLEATALANAGALGAISFIDQLETTLQAMEQGTWEPNEG